MSIDYRYEGFLCDLITLFEELAIRYINEKQIDIHKFMHYFNKFYDCMESLESSFHQNKLKITKYLRRLKENCTVARNTTRSFEGLKQNEEENIINKPISKPFVRSISTAKPSRVSQQLNSIEQEDEEHRPTFKERRSETAGGQRKKVYSTVGKDHNRPKTGKQTNKNRYFDSNQISKTINITEQAFTQESKSNKQFSRSRQYNTIRFNPDEVLLTRRRDFYEQLQKEKSKQGDIFSEKESNEIFKKFRGKAHKRLWQKINRLI